MLTRWYEVYDVYRRVFMIAVLPLLGSGLARAMIGLLVSSVAAVLARETKPFANTTVNSLLTGAQYQICLTLFATLAMMVDTASVLGLGDFGFGLLLVGINTGVVVMVGTLASLSANADLKMKKRPRGALW